MPGMTVTNQNDVREFIRNERRVELAFEDHRAWDTRRWMIADKPENLIIRGGVKVTIDPYGSFIYQPLKLKKKYSMPNVLPKSIFQKIED